MNPIPWYKSNTLRALLVAGVAQALVLLGIADEVASTEKGAQLTDMVLNLVEVVSLMWAGYARVKQPTPPIKGGA